jgi:hypothetical protein
MATTTATITLSSADLLTDSLSLSATQTLYKAGTTTGVEEYDMGRVVVPAGGSPLILVDATAAGNDKAGKIYVANKNTDETNYVIISMNDTVIGRLYSGDWMFIPWSQVDVSADIEVKAPNEANAVEWVFFHEGKTFSAA